MLMEMNLVDDPLLRGLWDLYREVMCLAKLSNGTFLDGNEAITILRNRMMQSNMNPFEENGVKNAWKLSLSNKLQFLMK